MNYLTLGMSSVCFLSCSTWSYFWAADVYPCGRDSSSKCFPPKMTRSMVGACRKGWKNYFFIRLLLLLWKWKWRREMVTSCLYSYQTNTWIRQSRNGYYCSFIIFCFYLHEMFIQSLGSNFLSFQTTFFVSYFKAYFWLSRQAQIIG